MEFTNGRKNTQGVCMIKYMGNSSFFGKLIWKEVCSCIYDVCVKCRSS